MIKWSKSFDQLITGELTLLLDKNRKGKVWLLLVFFDFLLLIAIGSLITPFTFVNAQGKMVVFPSWPFDDNQQLSCFFRLVNIYDFLKKVLSAMKIGYQRVTSYGTQSNDVSGDQEVLERWRNCRTERELVIGRQSYGSSEKRDVQCDGSSSSTECSCDGGWDTKISSCPQSFERTFRDVPNSVPS